MKGAFVVLLVLFLLTGCVNITKDGEKIDYYGKTLSFAAENQQLLKAMVKGSIYETGDAVSVFGTCLDRSDKPYVSASAFLSAWYPNGTVFLVNQSMVQFQPGYFVYQTSMDAVQGTYLTQMACVIAKMPPEEDIVAFAWGEWQNPYWANRIKNISADVVNMTQTLQQSQVTWNNIDNVTSQIPGWFNMTWLAQNMTNAIIQQVYQNLTVQNAYVAMVANGSVDRNDSLIYLTLINNGFTPVNSTGVQVNWTENAEGVTYYRTWHIEVQPYDPFKQNKKLSYPDVQCEIYNSIEGSTNVMTPSGTKFIYSVFINTRGPFTWTVNCYWS
jgi:hypothetical protein